MQSLIFFILLVLAISIKMPDRGIRFQSFKDFEASQPIGMCPAESMLILDRWLAGRECPNDRLRSETIRKPQNCKKDPTFVRGNNKVEFSSSHMDEIRKKHEAEFQAHMKKLNEVEIEKTKIDL